MAGGQASLICLLLFVVGAYSFHDADNVRYDCWPRNAQEGDDTIHCGGLGLVWTGDPPPDEVEMGQKFNITYQASVYDRFYTADTAIFPDASAAEIRQLCQNTSCPASPSDATDENCCVWHADIHICHPAVTEARRICGPWVTNNGELSTHTNTMVGKIDTEFKAANVRIDSVGLNFIIAHLSVGSIQIALGRPITVVRPRECGDGLCMAEIGETCETCAADCCRTVFPVGGTVGIVVAGVLIPITVVLIILGWYFFQKRKQFFDESWIINFDDIVKRDGMSKKHDSVEALVSRLSINKIDVKIMRSWQMFDTGAYEGQIVAIKKMPKSDIILTNAIRKEVLQVRTLDHPNLCKFIGATVKNPHNLCIISEYCPKGSLYDVLQNNNVPLNWGFRFSFTSDIACGMSYLHSKKIFHGRLTSSNCTIDDKWVLKITDYGLVSFRKADKSSSDSDSLEKNLKIYMPPEVRGKIEQTLPAPTTDVYSYSILLIEIATRMDPFSEDLPVDVNCKPTITKEMLTEGDTPCPCSEAYVDLINCCWVFTPSSRPTFDQIRQIIAERIDPNRESPVDMMINMMERYSKHVEMLEHERAQAEQMKQCPVTTLQSMLPRPVAEDLKHGKPVPAKHFPCATIFFSDIVDFTNLVGGSTALEMVNLVNTLYSTFDDILNWFDVHKITDRTYMVVSGVPNENGDKHASEIASMSLALLEACKSFTLPHRPDTKLEIRIGIHSGPVCAGMVGLKTPRYCLFGDTVNTASLMELSGEAMKIQCSDATYHLLKEIGGFQLECHGDIPIMGKGNMVTWWLVGQEKEKKDSPTGKNDQEQGSSTRKSICSDHSEQSSTSGTGTGPSKKVSFKKRNTEPQCSTGQSRPPLQSPKMSLPGNVVFGDKQN